jgi:type II secretory pathway pseudopilin PulG
MLLLSSNRESSNQGFASIVEVVVTSIIFIIATAGILSTVSMLQPHSTESSKKIEAAYLAKGILDEWRTAVLATPGSPPGSNWGPPLDQPAGTYPLPPFGDYAISYTIEDDNPIPNVRKVTMTVTW